MVDFNAQIGQREEEEDMVMCMIKFGKTVVDITVPTSNAQKSDKLHCNRDNKKKINRLRSRRFPISF